MFSPNVIYKNNIYLHFKRGLKFPTKFFKLEDYWEINDMNFDQGFNCIVLLSVPCFFP